MTTDARIAAKLPPTLIIGLGGTGCEIVSRIDKLSGDEQRQNIRFVYFDTDANELRRRKEETPYIHTAQISTKITVGQALRTNSYARRYSFPDNYQLRNKPMTEGAGQIRAVSKLAFDACLREGRIQPLITAVDELLRLNSTPLVQAMRVVIISTLVGGTGSGILLPVSMYLRTYCEKERQIKPIIRVFCLLPDVFFHGEDKTEVEKNNLRTNAYATLRELDAFLLQSDSTQSDELRNRFQLIMPKPGTTDEYDAYSAKPMDYCFLFDGLNTFGDGLKNFDSYIQHAADCIYASSISVLSKRLNSSEDNIILQLCKENGRNRYCGIGTSKIIYPFESVRDYIAMGWMNQSMTDDWLRYDNNFKRIIQQRQESKRRGVSLPPLNKRDEYCKMIESEKSQGNYFSLSVYEECYLKDDEGISFTEPRWIEYYKKLISFINDKLVKENEYDKDDTIEINQNIQNMKRYLANKDTNRFKNDFNSASVILDRYFRKMKRHAEYIASSVADSFFSPANFNIESEHHIEHWLTQNSTPLHPNSIRFFLYNLESMLSEELRMLETPSSHSQSSKSNIKKSSGSKENTSGKTRSLPDIEQSVRQFFINESRTVIVKNNDASGSTTKKVNIKEYVNSFKDKMNARQKSNIQQVISEIEKHYQNIKVYYSTYLKLSIIKAALKYIDRLCSSYEFFFQQLETEIKRIPRRMERIEESFVYNEGSPVIYACASKTCLNGLAERCPNTVDSISLTDNFREALFYGLYETMQVDGNDKHLAIVNNIVSTQILDFWRKTVIDQYGKKVDLDVIDALCTEAELEEKKFDAASQLYYVRDKRDAALKLSAPFIDLPIDREAYHITTYSLNAEMFDTDDLIKAKIIHEIFDSAEKDPLMDKSQMLFLKALYVLRVSDLPKFAPDDSKHDSDPRSQGSYYNSYWSRIDNILPDSKVTRILTPHLDKRWHYVGVMPDLSEKSDQLHYADAYNAFLISIAYGFVKYDNYQYRFINETGDFIADNIVVSDGRCNKLHEIYEAMLMSRPLVRNMLTRFATTTDKEVTDSGASSKGFKSTKLYSNLGKLHLRAFDMIPKISILELPLLCKASAGNSNHSDEESVMMLKNYLDFIDNYLENFYKDPYDRSDYFVEWMKEQTDLMIDNITKYYDDPAKAESIIMSKPFEDSLVNSTIRILTEKILSFDTCSNSAKYAKEITEKWNSLISK